VSVFLNKVEIIEKYQQQPLPFGYSFLPIGAPFGDRNNNILNCLLTTGGYSLMKGSNSLSNGH